MNRADALTIAIDALCERVAASTSPREYTAAEWAQIVIALRLADRHWLVEVAR